MARNQEHDAQQKSARLLTIACARCGQTAACFASLPAGTATQNDLFGNLDRIVRSGFMGEVTLMPGPGRPERLFGLLFEGRLGEAYRFDPDTLGFYCRECDAPYCQACWTLGPPVFDDELEGFYDHTQGVCPQGHTHIVDD
jgi:hypothetical protein